jgi:hypothetical protein
MILVADPRYEREIYQDHGKRLIRGALVHMVITRRYQPGGGGCAE